MNRLLIIATLLLPFSALADHMDVIEFTLKDGCSFSQYMEIVDDFNDDWGKKKGYKAEIAVPIQSENLVHMFWVGRTADAATFGKVWDTWRDELLDADSTAAKLWSRFQACEDNLSRRGYDVY